MTKYIEDYYFENGTKFVDPKDEKIKSLQEENELLKNMLHIIRACLDNVKSK